MGSQVQPDLVFGAGLRAQLGTHLPRNDCIRAKVMGFLAVILASVNIFGGFIVTQRMLSMFKRKQR